MIRQFRFGFGLETLQCNYLVLKEEISRGHWGENLFLMLLDPVCTLRIVENWKNRNSRRGSMTHPHIHRSKGNILVVDDTPTNLRLLVGLLNKNNYTVRGAINGPLALSAARKNPPDLILLDIMMPDLDGYAVCQLLKADDRTKDIPTIFISALDNPEDKVRAFEVGGADYIPKPFEAVEVLARVENQLRLRATQQELKANQEFLKRVLNAVADPIFVKDRNHRWTLVNNALCELIGATREEIIGRSDYDFFPKQQADIFWENDNFVFASGVEHQNDEYLTDLTGQVHILSTKKVTFKDVLGHPVLVGSIRDITEIKQAQEALQESEARFRAVFENAHVGISLIDLDGNFLETNPALEKFLGYSKAQLQTMTLVNLTHPEDLAIDLAQLERLLDGLQNSYTLEKRYIRSDGRIVWGRLTVCAVKRREQIQFTFGMVEDITARKEAEQALRRSEAQMRAIFAAMTDWVSCFDRDGRCLWVAPTKTTQVLNFSRAWVDQTLGEIFPAASANLILSALMEAIESQQTTHLEVKIESKSGVIWLDISLSPLAKDTVVLVARDISDRVQAQTALQQLANQLEQRVIERTTELLETNQKLRQEISDRIFAESELAKSEARFRLAADNIPDTFVLYDQLLRYQFVNVEALNWLNKSSQELLGRTDTEIFPPEISSLYLPLLTAAVTTQRRQRGEIVWPVIGEEAATLIMTYVPLLDEQGHLYQIIGIAHDITERKQAEQKIQSSYERLQLLSELTDQIRQSLDIGEILATAVNSVQQRLEVDRVSIVHHPSPHQYQVVQEVTRPGILDLPQPNSEMVYQRAKVYELILQGETPTSSPISIANPGELRGELLIVPIFIQKQLWGSLLIQSGRTSPEWSRADWEMLQQLANQIGIALSQAQLLGGLEERVQERTAELQSANRQLLQEVAERTKAETALRESEKQLRRIVDNKAYGVVVCRSNGRVCFLNRAAQVILGAGVAASFSLPPTLQGTGEWEINRADGSGRTVEIHSVDIIWEGEMARLISLMDITERKALEQMKDEFLSIASHELRTPLTSIRGSLGLLATGRLGTLVSQGQRMLEIAINNTDRLTRLLNDILDLERMKSGKMLMVKKPCDPFELGVQAMEAMQSMAIEAEIILVLEPLSKPLPSSILVAADPDQILQTLTNLIGNAIKFSEPGNTVLIDIQPRDRDVLFLVKDYGRGIPGDKLENIFGRFQQVDASDSRQKGGTGLGLAICKEIIRHHDGKIWAESTLGEGSTFFFTLPYFG